MNTSIKVADEQNCRGFEYQRVDRYYRRVRFRIVLALIAVVAIVYGVLYIQLKSAKATIIQQEQQIAELTETPVLVNAIAPQIQLDVINSEIQEIGELATVEYLFTDAAKFSDSKQIKNWNIPFTEKSFIVKWDGIIKAGVDVSKISVSVQERDSIIQVKIPATTILSYSVDNESIEVLDESNNVFNKISVNDKIELDTKTESAMKERAIENGLLEKAQTSAQTIITNLLNANPAINGNYTIQFEVFED